MDTENKKDRENIFKEKENTKIFKKDNIKDLISAFDDFMDEIDKNKIHTEDVKFYQTKTNKYKVIYRKHDILHPWWSCELYQFISNTENEYKLINYFADNSYEVLIRTINNIIEYEKYEEYEKNKNNKINNFWDGKIEKCENNNFCYIVDITDILYEIMGDIILNAHIKFHKNYCYSDSILKEILTKVLEEYQKFNVLNCNDAEVVITFKNGKTISFENSEWGSIKELK